MWLYGAKHLITVFSDHQSLEYFDKPKRTLSGRQSRWVEKLSIYDYKIIYRKGASNGKADALSRNTEYCSKEGGTDSENSNEEIQFKFGALEASATIAT